MQVFANAVYADVVEQGAFVDVDASLGVGGVGMHVAHLTLARKGTLDNVSEIRNFYVV